MRNVHIILAVLCLSCKPAAFTSSGTSETSIHRTFEAIESFSRSYQDTLYRGAHPRGEWMSVSTASQKHRVKQLSGFAGELQQFHDQHLTEQEQISKAVMLIRLNDEIDRVAMDMHLIPFNAEGGFYNQLSFVIPNLPFNTPEDYLHYLKWLPRYNRYLNENAELLKEGVAKGIVASRPIVENTLRLLKPWTAENHHESLLFQPLLRIPGTFSGEDKALIEETARPVMSMLLSTYRRLYDYFRTEYMAVAREEPGVSFIPGGMEWYGNRIRHYATLPLSADSIHALGLAEVARIRASMDQIIREIRFDGSYADFLSFLRTDSQFYARTPEELLRYASWLSKKAEASLPKLFNTLYTLPFTVEPVPAAIAPTYTTGRYVSGSWTSRRPGIYWVNTYDLPSRTLYTLPALTLHEAVPGHHLQNMIAAELKNIPAFRNRYYISAFGEGWGLYSEYLGEEMNMYTTPYEWFGRYTYEMWRACRLVVDTGIHSKGWTREEAIAFLAGNSALSMHEVTTEIDRYIGWPGQAISYKIGEIKIKTLRRRAEEALGAAFQIGEFHDAILRNGSVPLTVLEEQIEKYIKQSAGKK
jgi:uncharacterized protein (DUF885 family)